MAYKLIAYRKFDRIQRVANLCDVLHVYVTEVVSSQLAEMARLDA
jgi:hypothetical protein